MASLTTPRQFALLVIFYLVGSSKSLQAAADWVGSELEPEQ